MERLLWICLAGAIGTGTRYAVSSWAARALGTAFPWGTLMVNVAGCFLIALVMQVAVQSVSVSADVRIILTSGFLGGLTTYSSFNYETTKLVRDGTHALAFANLGATVAGCFVAGLLGLAAARSLVGG